MGASKEEQSAVNDRPVDEMSYTEASAELDAIVAFFEGRDVDVDQLVGRLVRATAIIEELDKRLRRTQMQVEQLVPRLSAVLEEAGEPEPTPLGERVGIEPDVGIEPGVDGGATAGDPAVDAARRASARAVDEADDRAPGLFS